MKLFLINPEHCEEHYIYGHTSSHVLFSLSKLWKSSWKRKQTSKSKQQASNKMIRVNPTNISLCKWTIGTLEQGVKYVQS